MLVAKNPLKGIFWWDERCVCGAGVKISIDILKKMC